jgi:hypothetical protein
MALDMRAEQAGVKKGFKTFLVPPERYISTTAEDLLKDLLGEAMVIHLVSTSDPVGLHGRVLLSNT